MNENCLLPLDPSSIICPGSSPNPSCIELGPALPLPSKPSAGFEPPKKGENDDPADELPAAKAGSGPGVFGVGAVKTEFSSTFNSC